MSLINLSLAKEALQITHDKENNVLQLFLDALEEWVQAYTGVLFQEGTELVDVEENVTGGAANLRPLQHPIHSITSITDRDGDDAVVTATIYRSNKYRIWFIDGSWWGIGQERYTVTYSAGYLATTLPAAFKSAIVSLMHRAYNKRGGISMDAVSGFSTSWQEYFDSDDIKLLRPFSFQAMFS